MTSLVPLKEDMTSGLDTEMNRVLSLLEGEFPHLCLEGLPPAAQALWVVALYKQVRRPLILLVAQQNQGETLLGDLRYFASHLNLKVKPRLFPTWELLPYEPLSPLSETSGERLELLHLLDRGLCPLLIVPVEAAMQFLMLLLTH